MRAWGIVPARGGSKSIPLKNLLALAGRPLLDYVACAGLASGVLERIICSTDHDGIAARAAKLGLEVDRRPPELAGDTAIVDDAVIDLLHRRQRAGVALPDVIVLLQPTSPFLQPDNIRDLLAFFAARPPARSAHNVCPVPHHLHAWNQRTLGDGGAVGFPFEAERRGARNKQQKPSLFALGNLLAVRTDALIAGEGFYAKPAYALPVAASLAFDLDHAGDVAAAEALIKAGLVPLDHVTRSGAVSVHNRS
jgi:CMP-N-acetylneuraminic acid synthetase